MATLVELQLFSGIENPQWPLTPRQEGDFSAWSNQLFVSLHQPAGTPIIDLSLVPSVGYTGFMVTTDHQPAIHVYGDALLRHIGVPGNFHSIDEFLFATHARQLYDAFGIDAQVLRRLAVTGIRGLQGDCPIRGPHCGTMAFPGHPSAWDRDPILHENACYNYANNVQTTNRVFPPSGSPHRQLWTPEQLQAALTNDGLVFLGYEMPTVCPRDPSSHYVAALLHTPGRAGDYHFLRLESNGLWSHKNGTAKPTDLAANGVIDDLCAALFATSTSYLFAGFFESTPQAQDTLRKRGK